MYEEQNCADYEVHLRRGKRSRRLGKFGGGEGIRTPDPLLAKQVLSRLSYTPREPRLYFSGIPFLGQTITCICTLSVWVPGEVQ